MHQSLHLRVGAYRGVKRPGPVATVVIAALVLCAGWSTPAPAAVYTYTPTSSTGDLWSAGTNWSATPVSGSATTLIFAGDNNTVLPDGLLNTNTDDISGEFKLNVLSLQGTGPAIDAGTINIESSSSASYLNFVSSGASQPSISLNAMAGGQSLAYNVDIAVRLTNSTTFGGDGTATFVFSGGIDGGGALTKNGASTLILTGVNTYSGGTVVSGGILQIGDGLTRNGSLVGDISTRQCTLVFANPSDQTFSGVISGTGNVTKTGAGVLTLSRSNTCSGTITIQSGTLRLASDNAIPNTTLEFNSGALSFAETTKQSFGDLRSDRDIALLNESGEAVALTVGGNSTSSTYSGALSGTGALTKTGSGVLTLSGANTHSGGTVFAGGILYLNHPSALGTGVLTIAGSGSICNGLATELALTTNNRQVWNGRFGLWGGVGMNLGAGSVDLATDCQPWVDGNVTVGGVIEGSGRLTQTGYGTLILANANTYTGDTYISSGTLQLGDGVAHNGSLAGNIENHDTLVFANPTDMTYGGIISGWNSRLHKTGAGALTLANSNSFSGTTTIQGGVLLLGVDNALPNATIDYNGYGGTLTFGETTAQSVGTLKGSQDLPLVNNLGAAVNLTIGGNGGSNTMYSGILSGPGSLTIKGTATLAGGNSYSGGTMLKGGLLNLGNPSAIGTGVLTIERASIDNTSGAAMTLANDNSQVWKEYFTFVGTKDLDLGRGAVTLTNDFRLGVNAGTLAVGGAISGEYELEKNGSGTLVLSGPNAYTGGTVLNGGQLNLSHPSALGTGAFTIRAGLFDNTSGAAMTLAGNNPLVLGRNLTFVGTQDLNLGSGDVTCDPMTMNCDITVKANTLTVGGAISGVGWFSKYGAGTLVLSGENTFFGALTVYEGKVLIANSKALQGCAFYTSGGAVDFGSLTEVTIATLCGSGPLSLTNNLSQPITMTICGAPWAGDCDSNLSGSGSVIKTGSGTLTLTGTNTYTGNTTVVAGMLVAPYVASLPHNTAGKIKVNSGGTLTINMGGAGQWTTPDITALVNNATFDAGSTLALGVDGSPTFSGNLSGDVSLSKLGIGQLTLSQPNTYQGDTTVRGGALRLTNGNALQNSTLDYNTSRGSISFGVASVTLGGLKGNQPLSLASAALSVGKNNQSTLFSGVINGTGSLIKIGTGTLTLGNHNSYSGGTTIMAGELAFGIANPLPAGSKLSLGGGTLSTEGFSQTSSLGQLALLGSDSCIDFGDVGNSRLMFADSSAATWSGSLTIANWSGSFDGGLGDDLFFGTSGSALTTSQLASIVFANPNGLSGNFQAKILPSGEVVPVPEPAMAVLAAIAGVLAAWAARRS